MQLGLGQDRGGASASYEVEKGYVGAIDVSLSYSVCVSVCVLVKRSLLLFCGAFFCLKVTIHGIALMCVY